jgi:pimeloyl-ACP methyl ester carboxylesterase
MVSFAPTANLPAPATHLSDVRLSNGLTLHCATQGPTTGPAVILLHGYSDSWFSFARVLPLLPAEMRVIVPDLRGHGDSERPSTGYRIADFADDVVRLMDALDAPRAVVVGHSMGSFVARKVYQLIPGRIRRLVLVGAGPDARNDGMTALKTAVMGLSDPVDENFVRDFQMSCVNGAVPQPFMEAAIANSRRMPARIWRAALEGLMDADIDLDRPAVRTLVLGGRQDTVFSPTEQMVLARQFPRGELHLIEGIGHTPHWEQPATFVSALLRFGV